MANSSRCLTGALVVLTTCLSLPWASAGEVHIALNEGETDRAIALLKKNPALIESTSDDDETPLHVASHRGGLAAVQWLLANKATVNAIAYNKFTPLHLTDNGEIAIELIKAGADLTLKDAWGNTPLQVAAEGKRQVVVEAILASGYKLDLRSAILLKKRDVVKQLLKDDPLVAKRPTKGSSLWGSSTPLGYACTQKDKEVISLLLDAGADINEPTFNPNAGGNATALTNAVWSGDAEIVALLLKRGAKTDTVGGKFSHTILEYARKHSSPEMVKLLEGAGK